MMMALNHLLNLVLKNSRLWIGVICCIASLPALGQLDGWQQMRSLGINTTARTKAVGFGIGTKGYIGTGTAAKDFWEYDPASNTWTQKATYPGDGYSGGVGFSIGSKGYIGTGANSILSTSDFWEYDPATNLWARKADFPGGNREGAVGFNIGSRGYLGSGDDGYEQGGPSGMLKNDFWEYNPTTDKWTQKAPFAGGLRTRATGIAIGNKGYVGLGTNSNTILSGAQNDFWQYDPATDQWMQKANYLGGYRYGACGFAIAGIGYIGTGTGIDTTQSYQTQHMYDFYWYDTAQDKWSGSFGYGGPGRENAVGFSIGNKGYFGTGEISLYYQSFGPFSDFYEFDPIPNAATYGFTQKASLGGGPRTRAVSFSVGGKGYIGTGFDGRVKKDFWVFDPGTNAWTQIADFAGGERESAFAFSVGSKGYVGSGDRSGEPDYKGDFYEYDPSGNVWTGKAGLLARDGIIGFSIGNKGYAAMGTFRATLPNDFYEYDPSTNSWTQKTNIVGIPGNLGVGFSLGNTGYLGLQTSSNNFYAYDPASDSWTRKADFGNGQEGVVNGFSLNGQLYALSGTGINDFWTYNPATNAWSQKSTFSGAPRQNAIAFSAGTNGFIGFGNSSSGFPLNDLWEYSPGSGNNILTGILTDTLCSRMSLPVLFAASGTYNPGNVFTAQLSDSSGTFGSPITIGSVIATVSDTIPATIPDSLPPGSHFRIRVVSSNPSAIGVDNGSNLIINPLPLAMARQNKTLYLDNLGKAILVSSSVDSGSSAYCGQPILSLDKTIFDCSSLGNQSVILTVTDGNGNRASTHSTVMILDTILPVVSGVHINPSANGEIPNSRAGYPPNEQTVAFTLDYIATDNCSAPQVFVTVSSNQANLPGLNGFQDMTGGMVLDEHHVLLRILPLNNRASLANSTDANLVYYIAITAKDGSGNATNKTIRFSVKDYYLGHDYATVIDQSHVKLQATGEALVESFGKSFFVKAMPNPSQHEFCIMTQSSDATPLLLVIQNLLGQVIERRDFVPSNGSMMIGSAYRPGFYVLRITRGEEHVTIKLLKE